MHCVFLYRSLGSDESVKSGLFRNQQGEQCSIGLVAAREILSCERLPRERELCDY